MAEPQDFFSVLGFPWSLVPDPAILEQNYLRLCEAIHPDCHSEAGEAFQEASEEKASLVNQAYQILKDDLSRAEYLLTLHGGPDSAAHRSMAPEILEQQLEWRERLEESPELDCPTLEKYLARVKRDWAELWTRLQTIFPAETNQNPEETIKKSGDWRIQARELLNHGRFLRTLSRELHERIHKKLLE